MKLGLLLQTFILAAGLLFGALPAARADLYHPAGMRGGDFHHHGHHYQTSQAATGVSSAGEQSRWPASGLK